MSGWARASLWPPARWCRMERVSAPENSFRKHGHSSSLQTRGLRYRGSMDADPHKPLREDVRLLGELLGETLKDHAGEGVFRTVERVRVLAKSARAGHDEDFRLLADELGRMPLEDAVPVARAFSQFLHLANIAEQHHRIRRRRDHQRDRGAPPQRASCDEGFARLIAAGISPDRLHEAVCSLRIELVLTAHP